MSESIPSPEARFVAMFEAMHTLCQEQKWGDPFSYSRSREIHMANTLGHHIAKKLSGADAYEDQEMTIPVEYKSTTGSLKGTYNGISVKSTWDEQIQYLREKKICCYVRHYFARYEGAIIVELWCLDGDKVLIGLLDRIQKQFQGERNGADPRLGATLSGKYIRNNGSQII
jgi:hypothetical protein